MPDFYTKEQRARYNVRYRAKHPKPILHKSTNRFSRLFVAVMDHFRIAYADRPRLFQDALADETRATRSYESILRSLEVRPNH